MNFKEKEERARKDFKYQDGLTESYNNYLEKTNSNEKFDGSDSLDEIIEFLTNPRRNDEFYTESKLVEVVINSIDKLKRYEYLRGYLVATMDFKKEFSASDFVDVETKKILEDNRKLKNENNTLRSAIKIVKEG